MECSEIKNPTVMKTKKIIREFLTHSNSNTPMLIALAGGIVAGALLGTLFAPERGRQLRKRLFNWNSNDSNEIADKAVSRHLWTQVSPKKPKSDIGSLIHQAHTGAHTEQGLS